MRNLSRLLAALFIVLSVSACGKKSPTEPLTPSLNGTWEGWSPDSSTVTDLSISEDGITVRGCLAIGFRPDAAPHDRTIVPVLGSLTSNSLTVSVPDNYVLTWNLQGSYDTEIRGRVIEGWGGGLSYDLTLRKVSLTLDYLCP